MEAIYQYKNVEQVWGEENSAFSLNLIVEEYFSLTPNCEVYSKFNKLEYQEVHIIHSIFASVMGAFFVFYSFLKLNTSFLSFSLVYAFWLIALLDFI